MLLKLFQAPLSTWLYTTGWIFLGLGVVRFIINRMTLPPETCAVENARPLLYLAIVSFLLSIALEWIENKRKRTI
ncbi:MAG: hypothetical protein ACRC5C_12220 [Bacilli bacterium]